MSPASIDQERAEIVLEDAFQDGLFLGVSIGVTPCRLGSSSAQNRSVTFSASPKTGDVACSPCARTAGGESSGTSGRLRRILPGLAVVLGFENGLARTYGALTVEPEGTVMTQPQGLAASDVIEPPSGLTDRPWLKVVEHLALM